jgi:hypothetical protein
MSSLSLQQHSDGTFSITSTRRGAPSVEMRAPGEFLPFDAIRRHQAGTDDVSFMFTAPLERVVSLVRVLVAPTAPLAPPAAARSPSPAVPPLETPPIAARLRPRRKVRPPARLEPLEYIRSRAGSTPSAKRRPRSVDLSEIDDDDIATADDSADESADSFIVSDSEVQLDEADIAELAAHNARMAEASRPASEALELYYDTLTMRGKDARLLSRSVQRVASELPELAANIAHSGAWRQALVAKLDNAVRITADDADEPGDGKCDVCQRQRRLTCTLRVWGAGDPLVLQCGARCAARVQCYKDLLQFADYAAAQLRNSRSQEATRRDLSEYRARLIERTWAYAPHANDSDDE